MEPKKIYELLREKIIWLELMPETYLNLSELAESFKVSRTPIKEALVLLQADGWVLRHGQHFMVTPLSLSRIKEITEIRMVLEIQANLWAMERISPEELVALNELKEEIKGLGNAPSNRQLVELDFRFHRGLYHATKNSQIAQLLDRLLSHYLRFWLSIPREIKPKSFFKETAEIIQAVESKNKATVKKASTEHIKKSIDEIMGTF